MIWGLALLVIGILLSAFFSGTETGFYRVSRVRLVLDAMSGNRVSRRLLWLANNPALFVATTLIGNNVANYLASLAIVLITHAAIGGKSHTAELVAAVALSPLVFLYGELLPKNLYYLAPNRLLHRSGWLFLIALIVFAPMSALLWALGRGLQSLIGQAPVQVRLALARKELQQVLKEGQEAGVLLPAQRALAQSMFAAAGQRVANFCTPVARVATVQMGTSASEVLRLARRQQVSEVLVREAGRREPVGYVRVIDLYLSNAQTIESPRKLVAVQESEACSVALVRLQSARETLARVVDQQGNTTSVFYVDRIIELLFRGV